MVDFQYSFHGVHNKVYDVHNVLGDFHGTCRIAIFVFVDSVLINDIKWIINCMILLINCIHRLIDCINRPIIAWIC